MSDEFRLRPDSVPRCIELQERELQWSWSKFAIGWAKLLMDKALWVWIVFTWIGLKVLKYGKTSTVDIIVVSGWIGVTVIYLLGTKGFNKMLENSKAEVKVGVGK